MWDSGDVSTTVVCCTTNCVVIAEFVVRDHPAAAVGGVRQRPAGCCVSHARVRPTFLTRGGDYRGDGGSRPPNILVGGTQT